MSHRHKPAHVLCLNMIMSTGWPCREAKYLQETFSIHETRKRGEAADASLLTYENIVGHQIMTFEENVHVIFAQDSTQFG